MIVLDTTVLVYATGAEHPYQEPCRRLVQAIADGQITATTTVEVVQEFVHVRARRRSRQDAAALGLAYADLLAPLLTVTAAELRTGLELYAGLAELGAFDVVLAVAARSVQADALVSADQGFAAFPGVPHVVPDDDGIRRLLAGSEQSP